MKSRTLRLILLIVNLILFFSFHCLSKEPALVKLHKDLPKILSSSNAGKDFWMTFLPCWETPGGANDLYVYVSSEVETMVTLEIPGKGYIRQQKTIPNDIIAFRLSASIGQIYRKSDIQAPEPDKVYDSAGVHVYSDDPIICLGVTRFDYTSDAFLAIPTSSLGKEYIVASWADNGDNSNQYLPSETGIVSVYDANKVKFTLGGETYNQTAGGQLPGETRTYNMYKGDVLSIASLGQLGDLSGSIVRATKPIAVVSGNFCAYVPEGTGYCDFLEEMELPTNTWGTVYHVTPIFGRLRNSYIKIFAKEADTHIYSDGAEIAHLTTGGGFEGVGWYRMRADSTTLRPVVISGDKPISVTQYNTGQDDDAVPSDPFQIVLTPVEQYQREIMFNTPGIRGGHGFTVNYINIVYHGNDDGSIPDDLQFATVEGGQFVWKKVNSFSPEPGLAFNGNVNGNIFSKTILLPGDGVYKLRANDPLCAYAYGFSDYDSYGYPANVSLKDLEFTDTLPPNPTYLLYCDVGFVGSADGIRKDALVEDLPRNDTRSNLSMIVFHSDESFNFKFTYQEFIPGDAPLTKWRAWVIDPSKEAKCVITFTDRCGNDTTITIQFYPVELYVRPDLDFGTMSVGDTKELETWAYNDSKKDDYLVYELELKMKDAGFSIDSIPLPFWFKHGDSIKIKIKFTATQSGDFADSVVIGDTCNWFNRSEVKAHVIPMSVEDNLYNKEPLLKLIPNPVSNNLTLSWNSEFKTDRIVIADILGNVIDDILINQNTSGSSFSLNTSRYADGLYVLKVVSKNQMLFRRFCVMK